ncbi:MAG: hypothetical protein LAT54_05965 [Cryomorphaceae bacterium]|nr:hypothetical protein [Cryomorphaceae bacterium]
MKFLVISLGMFVALSCQSGAPENAQSTSAKEEKDLFVDQHKAIVGYNSPLGTPVNWESYSTVTKHPKHDSARYFVAIQNLQNVSRNLAVYQVIFYENGEMRTEQAIQHYRRFNRDGVSTIQIEDPSGNNISFVADDDEIIVEKTGVALKKMPPVNPYSLLRKTSGLYLPGGTFQRCADDKIMAFFENEMYLRLNVFMKQLVGEKNRGSVILDVLYTVPDFGEPKLLLVTEIKMTDKRSSCQ